MNSVQIVCLIYQQSLNTSIIWTDIEQCLNRVWTKFELSVQTLTGPALTRSSLNWLLAETMIICRSQIFVWPAERTLNYLLRLGKGMLLFFNELFWNTAKCWDIFEHPHWNCVMWKLQFGRRLPNQKDLVIHIVGAALPEMLGIKKWEFLHHRLPKCQRLRWFIPTSLFLLS